MKNTLRRSTIAVATVFATAASGSIATAADTPVVITKGHVDFLYPTVESDKLNLLLADGNVLNAGKPTLRKPEDVVLKLIDKAWIDLSGKTNVAELDGRFAVSPQAQAQDVVWAGWEATQIRPRENVTFTFKNIEGPGKVFAFVLDSQNVDQNNKFIPQSITDDKGLDLSDGDSITTAPNHKHLNWVFSKPGKYTMKVEAQTGELKSEEVTYTWEVVADPKTPSETSKPGPSDTPKPPKGSSLGTGGIIAIIIAVLGVIGAAVAAFMGGGLRGLPRF
ncbi:choice-of-anchor M domain-containing protein [Corynebacterium felinum]|uniref:Surface-anchored protein n=1 Tax=Corynebacterium felinum TaxID=131318 RepID=A0ABU2B917_9CORY|nr:choice-of-anchor M domain-containing protein [Corynebacterium felinum]MDF5821524.1 choice-of-anchor M domain-containing protein [Corynebacterium felinum]MDR7355119.1 surface-anchored protein [Corynebacterium felinum]WJY94470.1 hypothetical protein CFELI_04185 [Corynebacterium felinum]